MLGTAFTRNVDALDFSLKEKNEQGGVLLIDKYVEKNLKVSGMSYLR